MCTALVICDFKYPLPCFFSFTWLFQTQQWAFSDTGLLYNFLCSEMMCLNTYTVSSLLPQPMKSPSLLFLHLLPRFFSFIFWLALILISHWTMLLSHRDLSSGGQPRAYSARTSLIDCTGNSGYWELVEFDPWHAFQSLNPFSCFSHTSNLSRPFLTQTRCCKYFIMLLGEYHNLSFGEKDLNKNTTSKHFLPFCLAF